ncbi:MAG: class I SAM-dependent methyltransferase [Gammaproteobacteria bacterium]|nr:class I SAM-dependent methyltransferase [Gammaproteobacteria bacterium]
MQQDKVWDFFQNGGKSSFEGSYSRLKFLSKKIDGTGQSILNIGVGNGTLERLLLAKGADIFSLDPSEKAIANIREELGLPEASAKPGYSQEIPFPDQSFDAVFMSEVIEHLDDDVLAMTLTEVTRVLKPGGRYLGTVPAEENLKDNEVVCPDCGKIFHRWGHVQSFSRERLRLLLQPIFPDLEVKRMYFGNWQQLNWKGKLSWILKKSLSSLGIKGAGENYYFSGTKQS